MPPRKKESGSLTGSKRFKEEKAQQESNSIGARAKAIAETAGSVLSRTDNNPAMQALQSQSSGQNNSRQSLSNNRSYTSSNLQGSDPYGGIAFPEYDFGSMMPGDLLNPQIQLTATEEQLTNGLAQYAAGTRAQKLLQAGFQYIGEIGKTKQYFHKAQGSVIKASTEQVKVQQELVRFDRQNVELSIDIEKLEQSQERLKQEQIITDATRNETALLIQKVDANQRRKEAEIAGIKAQTANIIQRYLDSSSAA